MVLIVSFNFVVSGCGDEPGSSEARPGSVLVSHEGGPGSGATLPAFSATSGWTLDWSYECPERGGKFRLTVRHEQSEEFAMTREGARGRGKRSFGAEDGPWIIDVSSDCTHEVRAYEAT